MLQALSAGEYDSLVAIVSHGIQLPRGSKVLSGSEKPSLNIDVLLDDRKVKHFLRSFQPIVLAKGAKSYFEMIKQNEILR